MRNLLILAFALTFAGAASAQSHEATIIQAKDDNVATIDQSGGMDNVATINQAGPRGNSDIDQVGSNNLATAVLSGPATSIQTQTGSGNEAYAGDRFDQASTITQIQTGDDNFASATTGGNSKLRSAQITQTQEGDENVSDISEVRDNGGFSFTDQYGFQNDADVDYLNGAKANQFEITQTGSSLMTGQNEVDVTFDDADNNFVDVDQLGDLNVATITISSDGNSAISSQTGSGNSATIKQQ